MQVFTAARAAAITADRRRDADAARVVASILGSRRRRRRHADLQTEQHPPAQHRTAEPSFELCDTYVPPAAVCR
jgi:hypothetical protein